MTPGIIDRATVARILCVLAAAHAGACGSDADTPTSPTTTTPTVASPTVTEEFVGTVPGELRRSVHASVTKA